VKLLFDFSPEIKGFQRGKEMATTAPSPATSRVETSEERFQRLRREARDSNPQTSGTPQEIKRDTIETLKSWDRPRRRANKIA